MHETIRYYATFKAGPNQYPVFAVYADKSQGEPIETYTTWQGAMDACAVLNRNINPA